MSSRTNTLKRLCDILNEVFNQEHNYSDQIAASAVWMNGLEITDEAGFNDFLCDFLAAIRSHEQLIESEEGINQQLHLNYINKVKHSLLNVKGTTWGQFRLLLDQSTRDTLMALAEATFAFWEEGAIPDDVLLGLFSDINELIVAVFECDLDDSLKGAIIEGLEAARHAVITYRVFGANQIRQAFSENVALMFRYRNEFRTASEGESGAVIGDYFSLIGAIDRVISVGLKIRQIAEHVPFLAMLSGDQ